MMKVLSIVFGVLGCIAGVCFGYEFFHLSESNVTTIVGLLIECAVSTMLSIILNPKASESTRTQGLMVLIAIVSGVIATLIAINL